MRISGKDWQNYIDRLRKINETAAELIARYVQTHECVTPEQVKDLITYAHAVVTKYGEGSAELACEMYEAIAEVSGVYVPAAVPAETATYGETAKAVYSRMEISGTPADMGAAVARLVKLAGVDTTMQNALRDGAEWAWVPHGDTCPYCRMLGSRGWSRASKKAIRNGHAEHIHANCDCTYAIRFDRDSDVQGYDPDALRDEYRGAGSTLRERINTLRRENYAENKDYINAQKRRAYAIRNNVRGEVPEVEDSASSD